jgi:hypothetical protein
LTWSDERRSYHRRAGVGDRASGNRYRVRDNSKVEREVGIEFGDVDQTILDTLDLDRWSYLGGKR